LRVAQTAVWNLDLKILFRITLPLFDELEGRLDTSCEVPGGGLPGLFVILGFKVRDFFGGPFRVCRFIDLWMEVRVKKIVKKNFWTSS
jgi:hypothetical protein